MTSTTRLVCAGETLVDLIAQPATTPPTFVAVPGGAPFNAAIAASRLGTATAFLGRRSTDGFGELIASRLDDEGVDTSMLAVGAELTTVAFAHVDDGGVATYSFHLAETSNRSFLAEDLPMLPRDAVLAVTLGAITLDDEPMGQALRVLMRREHGRRLVVFDPNVRTIAPDRLVDTRIQIEDALAHVDVVKVSDEDLATLHPAFSTEEVAARWLELGPALVIVTRADGADAHRTTGTIRVSGHKVDVVDTVAAGDTFGAGVVTSLIAAADEPLSRGGIEAFDDDVVRDALRLGSAAAAVVCTRRGAQPPTRAEVDAMLASAG